MDAHLFRRFCEDLVPALVGVRIEKIHQIASGVTVFTLYGLDKLRTKYGETEGTYQQNNALLENSRQSLFSDKKQYLIFKEGRNPLLFISDHRPSTGEQPPALIMRLRKYLAGRRIERVLGRWVERKLYLEIQGGTWLCIDLRQGVELILKRPENIFPENASTFSDNQTLSVLHNNQELDALSDNQELGTQADNQELASLSNNQELSTLLPFSLSHAIEPSLSQKDFDEFWPEWEQIFTWCNAKPNPEDDSVKQEFWQNYPVLTPLFRKTIPYLDNEEGAALYADLQYGGGDIAVYIQNEDKENKDQKALGTLQQSENFEICPWILPELLANKMGFSAEGKRIVFENSILALMHVGAMLLVKLSQVVKTNAVKPLLAEAKRLERLLQKLQKEEERLLQMMAKKELALVLQANLYSLNADAKEKRITFEDLDGTTHTIELDPSKSIRENMEHFFHVAGRGKRGIGHLKERRISIAYQHDIALQEALQKNAMQKGFESNKDTGFQTYKTSTKNNGLVEKRNAVNKGSQSNSMPTKQDKNSAKNKQGKFPTQIQAFRSSEGFLILRGRDTKGNGLVLKMSNPYDYWIHVAEGVGAHVIIRRDHPQQEIPLQTLHEAGVLALLKSWQKDQDKGLVQYSLTKYIRPMRGAGAGMVHVDKSEGTLLVKIEPSFETTLKNN